MPPRDPAGATGPTGSKGPRKPPPGLRAQIGIVRDAAMALVMAHVDLAKAEATAIAGEIGRVAAAGFAAFMLVVFAVFLAVIGTSLVIGEAFLGSIGWGVLHGVELFIALAVAAVLLALGISPRRIVVALIEGILVGVVVGVVLATNLLNQAYTYIGDKSGMAVATDYRPLVVGMLLVGGLGLLVGVIAAIQMGGAKGGRFVAIAGMTVAGVALGAFTAITFKPEVGAGIGIALGYLTWIAMMAVDVSRTGIDVEALQARFTPTQSIETGKETLEWLQKRMPPGIGS
jgi:hypothetical protein